MVRLDCRFGANGRLTTDAGASDADSRRLPRPECGFAVSMATVAAVRVFAARARAAAQRQPGGTASTREPSGRAPAGHAGGAGQWRQASRPALPRGDGDSPARGLEAGIGRLGRSRRRGPD